MQRNVAVAVISSMWLAIGCSAPPLIDPPCSSPIQIGGRWDSRAPGYLVGFAEGTPNHEHLSAELAASYGFVIDGVFLSDGFYARKLSPEAVAALRCDPRIRNIDHNERMSIPRPLG